MCQDILSWLLPSWTTLFFYFCYIHGCVYCITKVVVQLLSCVWLFATPWTAKCQASLSFTISWSLLKLMFIESVIVSSHLILCYPLLLPSIFPSIRTFPVSLFTLGGQRTGASAWASVLPMNIQGWSPLELTGWISLQSKGLSRVFSNTKQQWYLAQKH